MYKKPETETIPVKMDSAICSVSNVGFGTGAASGAALVPQRPKDNYLPK